jgi:transcriptional regulator with XRE-family HTH domain
MTLHVDYDAQRMLARVISVLRTARGSSGQSQSALSSRLPVSSKAISDWETGAIQPTLGHLIQWSRELGYHLVVSRGGGQLPHGARQRGERETGVSFERRHLATPLKSRRIALGLSQGDLARLVGVSRDSVQRWELGYVPPRPIALAVWAQKVGCSVILRPETW